MIANAVPVAALAHPTPLPTFGVFVQHFPSIAVQHLPKLEVADSGWAIAATIASIAVAVGTGILAAVTYILARETRDSLKVSRDALQSEQDARATEERRHMNGFMPHIAIEIRVGSVVVGRVLDSASRRFVEQASSAMQIYARNIGAGFAQNVAFSNTNIPNDGIRMPLVRPTAMATGDDRLLLSRLNTSNETIMGWTITYEDAFGRKFESSIANDVGIGSQYKWKRLDEPASS
jgi:hypothetical protein